MKRWTIDANGTMFHTNPSMRRRAKVYQKTIKLRPCTRNPLTAQCLASSRIVQNHFRPAAPSLVLEEEPAACCAASRRSFFSLSFSLTSRS
jgi:hypothetical protein